LAVAKFGVCDFSRSAVTDWRLRRKRLRFLVIASQTGEERHLVIIEDKPISNYINEKVLSRTLN